MPGGHRVDAGGESIEMPYLETFIQAAELSSFTKAGQALDLSQAAVSQRIGALEKSLGLSLFRRQGGRVVLTDAGRQLYAYAERILALHGEARREIAGQNAPVVGELVLAASSIPGEHLLPGLLAKLSQSFPQVRVRATVSDTQTVLEHVQHGRAHLGLVGGKPETSELEFRSFALDELVLILPPGHAWKDSSHVRLRQLASEPLIMREVGSGTRWCLERALTDAGKSVRDLRVTLELGSNEAIKEAVLQGLGLAFLSTHAVRQEIETKQLHAVRVSDLKLSREMFVVWNPKRAMPIPARLFLDLSAASRDTRQSLSQ
jgi:LysR family transcriptional regulator, low CO2-responsive transcriptional regulator